MDTHVVGLGAWCDYVTADEQRERLAASATPPEPGHAGPAAYDPAQHDLGPAELPPLANSLMFRLEEFATLSDGRRLTLTDDRGWSASASRPIAAAESWADLTIDEVERDIRNVVLPDDAEQTGDEHAWEFLTERLKALGVETTTDELVQLPYDVVLSPRLRKRLAPKA